MILAWLQGLDPVAQAALAGLIASVLLQIVKRVSHIPDEAKLEKWLAAVMVSALAALALGPETVGEFLEGWLISLGAASVWHESTDKSGAKAAWQTLLPAWLGGGKGDG
jgi:hypothetical protein